MGKTKPAEIKTKPAEIKTKPAEIKTKPAEITMKAVRMYNYGSADVLRFENATRPEPAADEVRIRVHAASINPVDWKIREGKMRERMKLPRPHTLGGDVSGVVDAVGPRVGNAWRVGQEVFAMLGHCGGGYAEYVCVKMTDLVAKPASLTHVQAAAVPLAGLTAWQALFDHGRLDPGQTVLIHGAAGGVGHFAVQFARACSALVTGTASGKNLEFLRLLGVNEAIDYEHTRFEELIRNIDLVLDLIGGETEQRSWQVLKPGGILVSTVGEPSLDHSATHQAKAVGMVTKPNGEQLTEIARLIDYGQVRPVVEKVFPLSEAQRAHEQIRHGHARGKTVLQVAR